MARYSIPELMSAAIFLYKEHKFSLTRATEQDLAALNQYTRPFIPFLIGLYSFERMSGVCESVIVLLNRNQMDCYKLKPAIQVFHQDSLSLN